jgi:hypothetical protein
MVSNIKSISIFLCTISAYYTASGSVIISLAHFPLIFVIGSPRVIKIELPWKKKILFTFFFFSLFLFTLYCCPTNLCQNRLISAQR